MSVKVKGSMYCPSCRQPVLAQKTGHGVRNTAAVGAALTTAGLSLLGAKVEKWRCPVCGGPAKPMSEVRTNKAIAGFLAKRQATKAGAPNGKVAWRCEKNGHLLDRKRTTCPIDGSPGAWRTS